MIRLAVVGLGKMGLSHHAMINAHARVKVAAVCDATGYVLDVLKKYTGVPTYTDFDAMLREVELDAIIIATPSSMHARMVKAALEKNIHVFCEKPFCLDTAEGEAVTRLAAEKGLVNQVGYHYRFVGAFQEVKRLLELNAIGEVTHMLAEAYGPVVLKPKGSTWRTQRAEGGGCLYDYAAHPLNLLNWYFGAPRGVGGSVLNNIFSADTDDEVFSTLYFDGGKSAQLSVNWSDESFRKMSTKISIWGKNGRIVADRQEVQVYLRSADGLPAPYRQGWNVRYTTELTEPVDFYLRGEEYSAQLDYFVRCIENGAAASNVNSFESAMATDRVISQLIADAAKGPSVLAGDALPEAPKKKKGFFFGSR
ncbi:gfo/Idh/MocA family oxidoreductase [Duganella sp. BJB488]|uniref:Gfo/Idh/MocA family protein n=1 Tax=unclassified Duganella TaxID=2636909 RepID=UPI000E350815|nr:MULTISPECIES: Gfo/Idh/MocA family oxidoreductase [unclassified Duganella]RFP12381.1 gfo/Idh/MocA family oxidoreductase [Duganella sp. BJB489]RFP16525.1 gfo/Idh/MocA family oxidoreductase [Duganella sp. BJB488]RFP30745.1 gfo/Idh/MocA family oxidoreductase [Duganella sp. BJB480]